MNPEAYNCRKKFHALQLQMVCDNNMVLTDVLAGWPGSVHDSRVLRNSSLCATAADKFPHDYHLLGDGGYPLRRWLMVPFRNNGHLPLNQVNFNRVLSSNRQIVERAVSLLKGRWRKLKYLDHLAVKLMVEIIMGACVLHNLCLVNDDFDNIYFLDDETDDIDNDDDNNAVGLEDGDRPAEQKRQHLVKIVAR
ncbi:putative nuclease HARBI1 [Dendronephthya gigantea]|uniref:putative nuclease HARBI1 n=1 Tax=Dendronephthya gigantea TaxID=151771 RepID=UPI0010696E16|nr:putative nuclease HARBI1 [Dendronephthya gigantea]